MRIAAHPCGQERTPADPRQLRGSLVPRHLRDPLAGSKSRVREKVSDLALPWPPALLGIELEAASQRLRGVAALANDRGACAQRHVRNEILEPVPVERKTHPRRFAAEIGAGFHSCGGLRPQLRIGLGDSVSGTEFAVELIESRQPEATIGRESASYAS